MKRGCRFVVKDENMPKRAGLTSQLLGLSIAENPRFLEHIFIFDCTFKVYFFFFFFQKTMMSTKCKKALKVAIRYFAAILCHRNWPLWNFKRGFNNEINWKICPNPGIQHYEMLIWYVRSNFSVPSGEKQQSNKSNK